MAGASDNGGWSSDGGSPDDLPDLPEEWGVIVIPDDLSELSDEVEAVRAELRASGRPTRWRRLLAHPAARRVRRVAAATLRAPVLIVSMAVLITVASLFASAWPGPPRQPATQRTASTTDVGSGGKLPALELFGPDGQPVSLRAKLPAVILLVDDCNCAKLVADTIAAVRPAIAVVVIDAAPTSGAPGPATSRAGTPPTGATPQAEGKSVQVLHPANGNVRSELKVGPPDETAAVLLVNQTGEIIRKLTRTVSLDDFSDELARL